MSNIALNLVVQRSPDIERSAAFYTCLGLKFSKHRHGNGPEHLPTTIALVASGLLAVGGLLAIFRWK